MPSKTSLPEQRRLVRSACSLHFQTCEEKKSTALKGNVNHSACRWCYGGIPMEELAIAAKNIGLVGIDLVGPADWPVLKKYDLISTMCNGAEINLVDGWNNKQFHSKLIQNYTNMIPLVAKAGYKNLICFSGNRRGMDDETGLQNCTEGLKQIMSLAEKNNVIGHYGTPEQQG